MNRIHSMPAIIDAGLSPSSLSSNDSAPHSRLKAAAHMQSMHHSSEGWMNGQSMSHNHSSNSLMSYSGSSPPPMNGHDLSGSYPMHQSISHPYMMSSHMMHPHGQPMYMHHPASSSPPMSLNPALSQSTPATYTVIPATVTTASIVPSGSQSMQMSKKMRKNSKIRSPGTKRVPLWDTVRNKKLSGFASPMEKNLTKYLQEHPNCVLYDKNLAAQHKMSLRNTPGENGISQSNAQSIPGFNENSDSGSDDEMPPELERIISSNDLQGIHSAQSYSPNSPAMAPFNQPISNGSGRVRFPPPLSSSLPLQHSNVPDPDQLNQQKQHQQLSHQQQQLHQQLSHQQQPTYQQQHQHQQQYHPQPVMHSSTMSPLYSPTTHGIQQDFEALTVNSLDLRASPGSSRKVRRNHGQLRSSSISQMSSSPINLPPNHSPHVRPHQGTVQGFGLHSSNSSTSLASYDSHEHHAALSSSVPVSSSSLPMHMRHHPMHHPGAQSAHRPPAVDTHFEAHPMHENVQYSSVLQSINPTNGHHVYSEAPGSASNTPRGSGVLRKNRSSNFYHQRVHPYSDRNSPRLGSSVGHSINERVVDDDPYSSRHSHSLPRNLAHSLPAPSFHEMLYTQNTQQSQNQPSTMTVHASPHERNEQYEQHRQHEMMHDTRGIPINPSHAVQPLDHHPSHSVPNPSFHSPHAYHSASPQQYQHKYPSDQQPCCHHNESYDSHHEMYAPPANHANNHPVSQHGAQTTANHMMKTEYYQYPQHAQSNNMNPSSRSVSSESSHGSSRAKRVSPLPPSHVKSHSNSHQQESAHQPVEPYSTAGFLSPVHDMEPTYYNNDFGLHFGDVPVNSHSNDQSIYHPNQLINDSDRTSLAMSPPPAPLSPIPLAEWPTHQTNHQDTAQPTSVYQLNYNDEHYDQLALQRQHEFFAFDGFM